MIRRALSSAFAYERIFVSTRRLINPQGRRAWQPSIRRRVAHIEDDTMESNSSNPQTETVFCFGRSACSSARIERAAHKLAFLL